MSVIWKCPNGIHPGVRGPSRPRRENIVRYCLSCSEQAGKLVERVAPTLEKQRQEKAGKSAAKAKARAKKQRTKDHFAVTDANGVVSTIDPRVLIRRIRRLKTFKDVDCGGTYEFTIRRSATKNHSSGHAWTGGSMVLTIASDPQKEEVEALFLHECLHVALHDADATHNAEYRWAFIRCAREMWPGLQVRNEGSMWQLHSSTIAEAQRLTKENA